jgi:signal transduction histidine kinase
VSRSPRSIRVYFGAVILSGIVIVAVADVRGASALPSTSGVFWLIAWLLGVAELFPILVPRRHRQVDEITVSTSFAFALVIGFGLASAIVVLAIASIVADLLHRKPLWKMLFNAAAYSVSLGAAGGLYATLGGTPHLTGASLPPMIAAGLIFMVLNVSLLSVGIGLEQDVPLTSYVLHEIGFELYTLPVLLALAPVILVAADRSPWLVPLAAAPVAAVHWGTKLAVRNAQLAARLQGSLDDMTELNRMKDDFVAVVSHELRTPLTSIQGYIKTLLQLSPELDQAQQSSFLEAADRQGERLRRLIEQLLVVSRLESHVDPLVVTKVSLSRLVALVVDELRPRANGHTFDLRIPAGSAEVDTDESKLHQILSNMLENALKYSPPDTRVIVRTEPSMHGLVLTVEDEGAGIPSEASEMIFERFYQVDQSATRRVGGTGLGLYICRRMADALGARIWLARSDPAGSEFSLFLPERPPEQPERVSTERPAIAQSITARV